MLLRQPIEERLLPDWSMGFHEVNARDADGADGYSSFLQQEGSALGERAEPAYRMLELFRQNMR